MKLRVLRQTANDAARAPQPPVVDRQLHGTVCRLIAEVKRGLSARPGEGVADVLARLGEQDLGEAAFHAPRPQGQPVLAFLPRCLEDVDAFYPALASDLRAIAPALQWRRTPSYTDHILGAGFNDNFGWTQIVGPHGFFTGHDFVLGLLMLGPDRHYPDHYQPAPELSWQLTAESFWSQDGKPFRVKRQGSTTWHGSMALHAIVTGASPLLTLWCWSRDTATPTVLKWM